MSVSQILTTYDGQEPTLCITGGGGGNVNSVSGGPGLTITGGLNTPQVNLAFTGTNQLLYGTGLNSGAVLGPGSNLDFLRINNSGNLEWHPISAGGVVSVSANPGGACFVNNSNSSTPAVAIAFPAGAKGALPASDGTGANLGAFLPGPAADGSQQNYVLSADNMSAVGFSWKAAAGTAITGEAPLVEFVDGTLTKVGINFGAGAGGIGQIPVGISDPAGKVGTLTPALTVADDGKVLTASSADAATGGVKWELPTPIPTGIYPVEVAGGDVYLKYSANKGDLFAGSGTVNTGALLPLGNEGEVLSVLATAPSGLAWVPQTGGGGGGPKIVRGVGTAPTIVDIPATPNDTLVLVAAEDAALPTWQPVPTAPDGPTPYNIEFEMPPFTMPNGFTIDIFFYNIIVNGRKCVELYYKDQTAGIVPAGHFYNSYDSAVGVYDEDTFVSCCIQGQAGILQPGTILNSFICGGNFNFFHYEDQSTPKPDVECHGLAEIAFPQFQLGVPTIKNMDSAGTIAPNFGLVLTAQVSQNTFVSKLEIYQGNLNVYGCFNAIATAAGNPFTTAGYVAGFASFASYDIADETWILPGGMLANGLGVYLNTTNPAAVGVITDAVRVGGTKIIITGEFLLFETTAGGQVPATCEGFAVYDETQTPNPWVNSPVNTDINGGFCVRPSVSIANSYIVAVEEVVATVEVSRLFVYDITANTLTAATGDVTTLPQTSAIASFNTITGLTIDIGAGAAPYDFILVSSPTTSPPFIQVLYMTGGGLGTTFLNPNPTGLLPQSYTPPPVSQALYLIDPDQSAFGISNTFGNTSPGLVIGISQNSKAQWNPPSAAPIVFTLGPSPKGFYYDNALFNTATFAPSIGTALYSSQMLVATADLNGWINVGAKATSLTYS